MNSEMQFETFLARLREGDDSAATLVTQRFERRLAGLADKRLHKLLQPKVDAQDAVQSAYKSFFLRCRDGGYELDGWNSVWLLLARITVRKCRKHYRYFQSQQRQVARETSLGPATEDTRADSGLRTREARPDQRACINEQLRNVLAALTERDRRIVELHLEGLDAASIAQRVHCTQRTAQRVLRRLRIHVEAFAEG